GNPHKLTEDLGIVDSGCSRSMTGNRHRLENFQEFKGGNVTFGGGEGKITGKGTIRTAKLDFENVLYVKELQHFNLFSVSQICDKKNRVLFTETECLVLTKDFKLPDETQVLLKVPRKHNLYSFNLEDLAPQGDLAYANEKRLIQVRMHLEVILCFDGEKVHNFSLVLKTTLHAERVAKSPTQVSSRSVKTYTRASKGSASEDTSSRMDFSPNAVTPGGLTHSSANQDIPADIFVTPGNMPISTGSGTIPAGVSVPTGSSTFPAGSEQVPPVSTSVDKGKAQLVDEPTPTQERTFKQLEDERLGWEAAERLHAQEQAELERQQEELLRQDELLARQLDQDFDIPAQQKKR
ncbi:hypothetical protein Tco_0636722, partial [Tanacetum coccineum]